MSEPDFDIREVEKFSKIADEWWKKDGKFAILHKINPLRLEYIKSKIFAYYSKDHNFSSKQNLKILDIGCGGGILSESLAKENFAVTALDPSAANIEIAKFHASKSSLNINYRHGEVKDLINGGEKFDIILAMEVAEHVPDPNLFLGQISEISKNDSLIFLSTINRTIKSYITTIILAEYILRWVPVRTHEWQRYIRPHEMEKYLENNLLTPLEYKGMKLDIISNQWYLCDDLDVNYFTLAKKVTE